MDKSLKLLRGCEQTWCYLLVIKSSIQCQACIVSVAVRLIRLFLTLELLNCLFPLAWKATQAFRCFLLGN